MAALYGSDITVAELREEVDMSREALVEEFTQDALDAYDEREERFGSELMREIERFVILQVVDTRWREHLESMDYLREGVHLRAMAQKDPLVEYRGEGHQLFEELSTVIQEEVVLTLFHVEVELQEAEQALQHTEAPQALSYEHETAAGAEAIAAAGGLATAVRSRSCRTRWSTTRRGTSAATTPAGAARARSTSAAMGRRAVPSEAGARIL